MIKKKEVFRTTWIAILSIWASNICISYMSNLIAANWQQLAWPVSRQKINQKIIYILYELLLNYIVLLCVLHSLTVLFQMYLIFITNG